MSEQFEKLGLKYFPTVANFIMVDVVRPAKDVYEGLLEKGIIVRGGHNLGMPTHLRVTVGSREQNEKFIAALEQVLQQVPAAGIAQVTRIAIYGVGLIGGSLALCFKRAAGLYRRRPFLQSGVRAQIFAARRRG